MLANFGTTVAKSAQMDTPMGGTSGGERASGSPRPIRRWSQFSLRGLIIAVLISSMLCAWLGREFEKALQQRRAIQQLRAVGVKFDTGILPEPAWRERVISWLLGDECLCQVAWVEFITDYLDPVDFHDDHLDLLEHIPSIESLTLIGQRFTDASLTHVGRLRNVKSIVISNCPEVTDVGLSEIMPAATHVTHLDLRNTAITDAGVAQLESLPNLVSLELVGTKTTGRSLDVLGRISTLNFLEIDSVTDSDVAELTTALRIRMLMLDGGQLTSAGLQVLRRLSPQDCWSVWGPNGNPGAYKRRGVFIRNHRLTNDELRVLTEASPMTILTVSDSQVTDEGLRHLERHDGIEILDLDKSQITDQGLSHLAEIKPLHWLNVAGTAVSAHGLLALRTLPNLRYINVGRTQVTPDQVNQLRQEWPTCFVDLAFAGP